MSRRPAVIRTALLGGAILVVLTCPARAQMSLHGKVLSAADGTPVTSAEVIALQSHLRTRTDDRGEFRLLAADGDSIRVRALGFRERILRARSGATVLMAVLPTTLARVVTTAGQRVIRTSESAASVTVLDRAAIDAVNAVSANQLLRQLPGLQELPSPPARTSISIRGLDQSRVLVLVDGEPVPSALSDNRDIGRLSTLAAERIEVTKGPSSSEFGSEALGGVINLVTAAPSDRLSASMSARTGGLGRQEASADVSNTVGAVGVRLSGGWRQSDRVTAIDAAGTTLDRVYDFRGDTRVRLSDRLSLRGNVALAQQRQRWPVGAGFNGFIDNHSTQGFIEAQLRAGGGLLRARAFSQAYAYQFREALGALPIAGSADSLEQRERLDRALLAYSRSTGRHSADAGIQVSSRGIVAPRKVDGDSLSDHVTEFFVRDAVSFGAVLLTVGGRTTTSSLWGTAFAPSVGAVWQASPEWRVRATRARGFRAPSFKELRYTFLNGAAGYTVAGNPALRPESSWSTSIGGSWAPTAWLTADVEGYRNAVSNLIATRTTGLNGAGLLVYQNVNVERARTEGVESALRLHGTASEFSLGYDFLNARDLLTGRTLDGRSRHTARATAGRRWAVRSGITTDISVRYTGAAPRGQITQGAFLSLNGQLRMSLSGEVELSLAGSNLLDRQPVGWTPAFRRQITVGVRARLPE